MKRREFVRAAALSGAGITLGACAGSVGKRDPKAAERPNLLFDNKNDPYQMTNLAGEPKHSRTLERFRKMLAARMKSLNDTFEQCTWYRDNWTDGNRNIIRGAKG